MCPCLCESKFAHRHLHVSVNHGLSPLLFHRPLCPHNARFDQSYNTLHMYPPSPLAFLGFCTSQATGAGQRWQHSILVSFSERGSSPQVLAPRCKGKEIDVRTGSGIFQVKKEICCLESLPFSFYIVTDPSLASLAAPEGMCKYPDILKSPFHIPSSLSPAPSCPAPTLYSLFGFEQTCQGTAEQLHRPGK